MKLTDPEKIQESEKEFIDTINAELNWETIEQLLLEKYQLTLHEQIEYKDADFVVYKNNIAYKFDFEIKVPLSIIFNRSGECLDISTARPDTEAADAEGKASDTRVAEMASNIADMISEINREDD